MCSGQGVCVLVSTVLLEQNYLLLEEKSQTSGLLVHPSRRQ